jgi:uncharacterized protein YkwD
MKRVFTKIVRALAVLVLCAAYSPSTATAQNTGVTVLAKVNAIRAQAGLAEVKRHPKLDAAARAQAMDMATNDFLGHTGSDGSDLRKRVDRVGYDWCTLAENVSRGYKSDARAIEAWRVSKGHHANITKRKAREFGYANVNGFRVLVLSARRC